MAVALTSRSLYVFFGWTWSTSIDPRGVYVPLWRTRVPSSPKSSLVKSHSTPRPLKSSDEPLWPRLVVPVVYDHPQLAVGLPPPPQRLESRLDAFVFGLIDHYHAIEAVCVCGVHVPVPVVCAGGARDKGVGPVGLGLNRQRGDEGDAILLRRTPHVDPMVVYADLPWRAVDEGNGKDVA
eukprot:CAMPEP_0206221812 /NCGR_PEP_ID=MMETSP0047_2-20121206/5622_1 /ASSEMBLY_ACC=CAM_ASM_000192 /TAXON_ID=195065 /ORGANISM="Chroomonas mesostigmatica_cf, Strain CCMP1168" /LENGTH=179 /DNA_ID=CAMNT_0053644587 /DNA_START=406 /DNA_END=946 /DNA_ORIENTATION=-